MPHDAGVGLLLPQQLAGLGVEGAEVTVIGAADEDEIARRSPSPSRTAATSAKLCCHTFLPVDGIPGLELAEMIGARLGLQADVFRLGAEPELARLQRHLFAGEAAAEILVGGHVDEAGLLAIGGRRPVLAAPQRGTELDALADDGLVGGIDDRPAGFGSMPFQTSVSTNGQPAT